MTAPSPNEVTQLLLVWSDGDQTALEELTPLVYAELHRLVELPFFGGLSVEETAEALNVSPRTVMREWSLARDCLYRELSSEKKSGQDEA